MANETKVLDLQIRDTEGDRVAGFFYAEDAASFIGGREGYRITYCRETIWTEGAEIISAAESFDRAAQIMHDRMESVQINRTFNTIRRVPL